MKTTLGARRKLKEKEGTGEQHRFIQVGQEQQQQQKKKKISLAGRTVETQGEGQIGGLIHSDFSRVTAHSYYYYYSHYCYNYYY